MVLMPKAPTTLARENLGGGQSVLPKHRGSVQLVSQRMDEMTQKQCIDSSSTTATDNCVGGGTYSEKLCSDDGSKWHCAEYVYEHWVEMGAT